MLERNLSVALLLASLLWGLFLPVHADAARKPEVPSASGRAHKRHLLFLNTMSSEMKRLLGHLKRRAHPKVYYMRFRLQSVRTVSVSAEDGLVTYHQDSRATPVRRVQVQLRVGNHRFDQTGRIYLRQMMRTLLPASRQCPSELTPTRLRKMLWKNTDRQYRIAVAKYWKKRYLRNLKARIRDKSGDFSKEPPTVYLAPLEPKLTWNAPRWKKLLQKVSHATRRIPGVLASSVRVYGVEKVTLGVASDGSKVRRRSVRYHWSMSMRLLGKNKEILRGNDAGFAPVEGKLPTESTLRKKFRALWKRLHDTVHAEEGETGEGPAIVDPQLASAMLYDILMIRLGTQRFLKRYSPRTFEKKLGKQILPSFLDIVDDPTRSHWEGTALSAHYLFDDEWVRARPLPIVRRGVLKNFYRSRKPYKKWKRSNGFGRSAFGYQAGFSRPSVVLVKSRKTLSQPKLLQALKKELRRQKKRYGYLLRGLQGNSSVYSGTFFATPVDVFRFDSKTGQFKRFKRLRIRSSALGILKGILATGKKAKVFNGSDSENSGLLPISVVTPSLLLKSVSFQRQQAREKKPFELPPPFKAVAGFPALKEKRAPLSPLLKAGMGTCHRLCQCPTSMLQWTTASKMACLQQRRSSAFLGALCSAKGACGVLFKEMAGRRAKKRKKQPGKVTPRRP